MRQRFPVIQYNFSFHRQEKYSNHGPTRIFRRPRLMRCLFNENPSFEIFLPSAFTYRSLAFKTQAVAAAERSPIPQPPSLLDIPRDTHAGVRHLHV